MPYQNITDVNLTKGYGEIIIYINNVTNSWFSNMLLISAWIILTMAVYHYRRDFPQSIASASFTLLVVAVLLRLGDIISQLQIGIVIAVTVASVILLIFSKD